MPKPKKPAPLPSNRPPVITVMGHIDHGKTTLLDALRKTNLVAQESGGITQHIGAYQLEYQGRQLTFIDTPGHAAFASMRLRGAQVTDLVILVVDAVESVKPQTKESLQHIKAAKVPFMVAITKIDLPNASSAIVKKDLADCGVLVEGYGGDIVCVEISAKTGKNLDQLLEMLLLLADMQKIPNQPQAPLEAVVIESTTDPQRGPLATVIVKQGTLKLGQEIFAPNTSGKVKALFDDRGQKLTLVLPGQPAQVLGFKKGPPVGAKVTHLGSQPPATSSVPTKPVVSSTDKKLNIILKADVAGTLEAITQNLSEEVVLISSGVGDVSEADVLLAQATKAKIIGFRVTTTTAASKLAETERVLIKNYALIYELLDDLQEQILKILEPTIDEEILGEVKIIAQFTVKGEQIAGGEVVSGKLTKGDLVHLIRNKEQIADAKIKAIHQGKEEIDKAKRGQQAGISFTTPLAFQLKDKLQAYRKL